MIVQLEVHRVTVETLELEIPHTDQKSEHDISNFIRYKLGWLYISDHVLVHTDAGIDSYFPKTVKYKILARDV